MKTTDAITRELCDYNKVIIMVNWSVGVCVHGNRGYQSYSTDFNDAVCCVWSLLFSIEFVKEG